MSQDLNKVKAELENQLTAVNSIAIAAYEAELEKVRKECESINWDDYQTE